MEDPCNFAVSSSLDPTEISIYQISGDIPQYYLLKKTRSAISATVSTQTFSFGAPQQFATVDIDAENIIGILLSFLTSSSIFLKSKKDLKTLEPSKTTSFEHKEVSSPT
jgi:hypothetical protein